MSCLLCQTNTSFETPNDRVCAFDADGRFRAHNLHCGSMEVLIQLPIFRTTTGGGQMSSVTIGLDGDFLVLAWSGAGSRIAYASVLLTVGDGAAIATAALTVHFAERVIADRAGGGG